MSALRIAAVTHVLKDLLNDGLINQNIAAILDTTVTVSSVCPAQVDTGGDVQTQLNLFLYRTSVNTAWSNLAHPYRNTQGERTKSPPLAVNLHYLLTAFGRNELDGEILLGYAMQLFHENAGLGRDLINNSLVIAQGNASLPPSLRQVASSGLADQIEQVKISHDPINMEEMTRLWTAFQIRYRPCAAYTATVVLLERERRNRPSLPVQKRQVFAVPFQRPLIEQIVSQAGNNPANPIVEMRRIVIGDRIIIKGQQLRKESVYIQLNQTSIPLDPNDADTNITPTEISFVLDIPPGQTLKAGVQGLQVIQPMTLTQPPEITEGMGGIVVTPQPSIQRGENSSNLQSFVLSPSITIDSFVGLQLELGVSPDIETGQRTVLLLNEINALGTPQSYSFVVSTTGALPLGTISVSLSQVTSGDYLVRLVVDGAESPLTTVPDGTFNGPLITIP
ncbi:MAG: DUF4255 domain-containing protein [Bacteroidota bacterium]